VVVVKEVETLSKAELVLAIRLGLSILVAAVVVVNTILSMHQIRNLEVPALSFYVTLHKLAS
jgi:hypothetical protein